VHDAAIEPSSPARYPDIVTASPPALSADFLNAATTSLAVGALAWTVVVLVVVVADVDVAGSPVNRAISADSASACFDRSDETEANAGRCGGFAASAASLAS
jgi:hypothetical protein